MIVRIVLWSLSDAAMGVAELREYLRDESVPAYAEVPGLRLKLWISDEGTERWGAVYLFESREAADAPMPSRVRELVGKDPDLVEEFDLEASVEGRFAVEELGRRGLSFEA
ncbi:MAG TPA: YdhR family protein [Gaiellaceae bacterium]|nr:YdhR family protein [Gaiellaceae bacterium]